MEGRSDLETTIACVISCASLPHCLISTITTSTAAGPLIPEQPIVTEAGRHENPGRANADIPNNSSEQPLAAAPFVRQSSAHHPSEHDAELNGARDFTGGSPMSER